MFEFMKDYEQFRKQIRDVKVETFNELKGLLDENEKLKRELRDKDAKHEREIMTLSHSLQLERERFAVEREQLIAKTKGDLYGERERFLEKNFADLQATLKAQHDATKDVLGLVITRLPDVRLRMEGDVAETGNSRRALPTVGSEGDPKPSGQ
jgi:hypothetical protein